MIYNKKFLTSGLVLISGLIVLGVLSVGNIFAEKTQSGMDRTVNISEEYLSTKTPYHYEEQIYTKAPEGYEPVFINYVGRHGSRHLSSSKYDKTLMELLSIAESEGQITQLGLDLKNEVMRLMLVEKDNYGLLTQSGEQELKGIGIRVGNHYSEIFKEGKEVIALATFKDRTPQSRDQFISGLEESLDSNNLSIFSSSYEENKDPYLRPYDLATEYNLFAEEGEWIDVYENYISQEKGETYAKEILLQFFSEAFYERIENGDFQLKDQKDKVALETPTDAASNLYQLYIISAALKSEGSFEFGKYFTEEQLKWYESIDNIEDFYEKGPSLTATDLPQNISAPLVKELLNSTQLAIDHSDVAGIFRFAHAETIIPLSAFLDIEGANRSTDEAEEVAELWRGSIISPMGANIQWILYTNGKEHLVKMLRNEKEIAFPIQTENYPYYKWDEVKDYYKDQLEKVDIRLENSLEKDIIMLKNQF